MKRINKERKGIMETVTRITAREATKMYYENKKLMKEKIGKGKKLTFYNVIWAAIIT